jgi:hypothetical protein
MISRAGAGNAWIITAAAVARAGAIEIPSAGAAGLTAVAGCSIRDRNGMKRLSVLRVAISIGL